MADRDQDCRNGTTRRNIDASPVTSRPPFIDWEEIPVDHLVNIPTVGVVVHGGVVPTPPAPIQWQDDGIVVWFAPSTLDGTAAAMASVGMALTINDNQVEFSTDGVVKSYTPLANMVGLQAQRKLRMMRRVSPNMKWQCTFINNSTGTDYSPSGTFGFISKQRAITLGIWDENDTGRR